MLDEIDRKKMIELATSDRMNLRLIASQIGAHLQLDRDSDLFIKLTEDHHHEVRAAALQTLGLLRISDPIIEAATKCSHDPNPKVALSAAWLLALHNPQAGLPIFKTYLGHYNQNVRLYAAAACAATGQYGAEFALDQLVKSRDPYVKMNLAIGLVGQRMSLSDCGKAFYEGLEMDKDKWHWKEEGIFRYLAPQTQATENSDEITPEEENQLVRLEILNILAMLKDPRALEAIKKFALERSWSISWTASALLLCEGNEEAIAIVKNLLKDPNPKLRVQAALILSLWSREEEPIQILQQGYQSAKRDTKIKIIEGIGRIGSMSSVPFLIEILKEPSQSMRMLAAMALIQCLNH